MRDLTGRMKTERDFGWAGSAHTFGPRYRSHSSTIPSEAEYHHTNRLRGITAPTRSSSRLHLRIEGIATINETSQHDGTSTSSQLLIEFNTTHLHHISHLGNVHFKEVNVSKMLEQCCFYSTRHIFLDCKDHILIHCRWPDHLLDQFVNDDE